MNDQISQASNRLINSHKIKFKSEKILSQRCHIRLIPISTIFYNFRDKSGEFFIYGREQRVYCPETFPRETCSLM